MKFLSKKVKFYLPVNNYQKIHSPVTALVSVDLIFYSFPYITRPSTD